jgi:predicted oxidoreductase
MDANQVSRAFKFLKEKGMVKNFGVSNFTSFQFDLVQSRLDFKLVTNQVSGV